MQILTVLLSTFIPRTNNGILLSFFSSPEWWQWNIPVTLYTCLQLTANVGNKLPHERTG